LLLNSNKAFFVESEIYLGFNLRIGIITSSIDIPPC